MIARTIWLAAILSAAACESGDDTPTPGEAAFSAARLDFPTILDLQTKFIAETCSPNPGVCHQGREYPDLRTLVSFADSIGADCNISPPAPELGWDACERPPDWVQLGDFGSAIAWTESLGPAYWALHLANPIPSAVVPAEGLHDEAATGLRIIDGDKALVFAPPEAWMATLSVSEDAMTLWVELVSRDAAQPIDAVVDTLMAAVIQGDPNRNGVWGGLSSDPRAAMVVPGSLRRSYLWRRMIGDVPGDRMPLANGPVTHAELLALGCLIEGLDPEAPSMNPHDPIDYDACSFAEAPDLAVEDLPGEDGETGETG